MCGLLDIAVAAEDDGLGMAVDCGDLQAALRRTQDTDCPIRGSDKTGLFTQSFDFYLFVNGNRSNQF